MATTMQPKDPPRMRKCGTMEVHHHLLERFPEYRTRLASLEGATRMRLATRFEFRQAGPTRIPVVVHVVYRTDAENISKTQIDSQIDVLNKDYSASNSDRTKTPDVWKGLAANASIQFLLALSLIHI